MQLSVLRRNGLKFSQGAAFLLLAGVTAGCSSQMSRFGGVDDFMTASTTPNQRQIIRPAENASGQTYGDSAQYGSDTSGGYSSGGAISRSTLAAPGASASAPAPVQTASLPPAPAVDHTTSVATQQASIPDAGEIKGWSRAGGTQVTVKEGETAYNLSRRFGVPADVILKSNGLSESAGLKAGSKIVIPTYVYSDGAGVSAPDNNPNTAKAKSSTGEQQLGEKPKNLAVLPPEPKNVPVANAAGTYKVQAGDTLSRISRNTGVSVSALQKANGITDGSVRIGQTLTIPGASGSTKVASAQAATDSVVTNATKAAPAPAAAAKQPEKKEEVAVYTPPKKADKVIQQAEEDNAVAPDATGIGRMRWPVRGRVISQYGKGGGKSNDGIDISVPEGTSVKAAENGVVIYAGDGLKEFGNTVLVRHEDGLVTVYGHANALKVQRGDKVKRGQEIAVSGMSGQTDAPKLHFEVRKNSTPVDPSTYLE